MTTKQSNIDGQVTYIVLAKEKLAFTSKDHETGPDHLLVVSSISANEALNWGLYHRPKDSDWSRGLVLRVR